MTLLTETTRKSALAPAWTGGLLLVIAAAALAQPAGDRYQDARYGYSLAVPPGWTRKADMPPTVAAFVGPTESGFQVNFNVYCEPAANKTLQQYVRAASDAIAASRSMTLQTRKSALMGGRPAVVLQSVIRLKAAAPTVSRQVLAVHAGRGYVVTLSVPPASLNKYSPIFGKVVSSFRWQR